MNIIDQRKALFNEIFPSGIGSPKQLAESNLIKLGYHQRIMELTAEFDVKWAIRMQILRLGDIGRCCVCGNVTNYSSKRFTPTCSHKCAGIAKRGTPAHNKSTINENRIVELYKQGYSMLEISKMDWCGVSNVTVSNILSRNGVELRTISETQKIVNTKYERPPKVITIDPEIVNLYRLGYTMETIAKMTGKSLYSVKQCIKVRRNPTGQWLVNEWLAKTGKPLPEFSDDLLAESVKHKMSISLLRFEFEWRGIVDNEWIHRLGKEYQEVGTPYLAEKYHSDITALLNYLQKAGYTPTHHKTSKPERLMLDILDKHNIGYEQHNRQLLQGKELDIYIPAHNLAIEINGVYWHTTTERNCKRHLDKFNTAHQHNIKLLQFTDIDILHKPTLIESMILARCGLSPNRIMARKCNVIDVPITQANYLFELWHYQGKTVVSAKVKALLHDNEIIALLAYTVKDDTTRIERFACKPFHHVVGAYTKLEAQIPGNTLVTFSLGLISDGALYRTNGYVSNGYNQDPEFYVYDGMQLHNRQRYMKHKLPKLFPNNFNPALSEHNNIVANGLTFYYGAGITNWVKHRNK